MKTLGLLAAATVLSLAATGGEHKHEHKAPHHGTLVVFGEEFAHIELVLDKKTGKLTAYVLDGEAEKAVRIKLNEIELKINKIEKKSAEVSLKLKGVANVLTGEKEGDTSEFSAQSDDLKGVKKFEAVVSAITIKGKEFKDTKFKFPEGNEGHHDHDH
jgi:hypothetical protein